MSYCVFCFLSFFPYLLQCHSPFCLAPSSLLFVSLSIVLSAHLSSPISWCSFLFLLTVRQSRPLLKSTSLFCSVACVWKRVLPPIWRCCLGSPRLITHNLSIGYIIWFSLFFPNTQWWNIINNQRFPQWSGCTLLPFAVWLVSVLLLVVSPREQRKAPSCEGKQQLLIYRLCSYNCWLFIEKIFPRVNGTEVVRPQNVKLRDVEMLELLCLAPYFWLRGFFTVPTMELWKPEAPTSPSVTICQLHLFWDRAHPWAGWRSADVQTSCPDVPEPVQLGSVVVLAHPGWSWTAHVTEHTESLETALGTSEENETQYRFKNQPQMYVRTVLGNQCGPRLLTAQPAVSQDVSHLQKTFGRR